MAIWVCDLEGYSDLFYSTGEKYSDFQFEFIRVCLVSLCSCVSTVLQLQVFSHSCVFPLMYSQNKSAL